MEIIWIIIGAQALICGALSSNLAEHKGYSSGAWFASGFFLGVFGLIAAAGLPSKLAQASASGFLKKCPDCAESIRKETLVCKFCGKKFNKEQVLGELVESLQGKSTTNALLALDALRSVKDNSVIPPLIKLVDMTPIQNATDSQFQLLSKALELLAEYPNASVAPELASVLKKTNSMLKANSIVQFLGKLRDPSSISVLTDSLQRTQVRDAAARALEKFGQSAIPALEQLTKDGKRGDRKLAERIIARIRQTSSK